MIRPIFTPSFWAVLAASMLAASCSESTRPDELSNHGADSAAVIDAGGRATAIGSLQHAVTLGIEKRDTTFRVVARGRITNAGTQTIRLEFGACALQLLAYRNPDRTGTPVWNSDRRKVWNQGFSWACPLYLAVRDLAPGATLEPGEFSLAVPLIEVLGDSLPDGRYWFSAQIRTNLSAAARVDAGVADLALARSPLPNRRISEVLTFLSDPVTVSGSPQQVTARGRIRLDYASGALVTYPGTCALRLHAYADRARRDAAPRSGPADWIQQPSCFAAMESIVLSRGQEKLFQTTVAARDILGNSRPAGRYFFAVEILAEDTRVFLTAGEAELSR